LVAHQDHTVAWAKIVEQAVVAFEQFDREWDQIVEVQPIEFLLATDSDSVFSVVRTSNTGQFHGQDMGRNALFVSLQARELQIVLMELLVSILFLRGPFHKHWQALDRSDQQFVLTPGNAEISVAFLIPVERLAFRVLRGLPL
jgi:hypothetical protein